MTATAKKDTPASTAQFHAELAGVHIGDRTAPSSAANIPQVDPARVTVNHAGHAYTTFFARMPEGVTKEDITHPGIWAKLQSHAGKALRAHDEIRVVAYDESWAVCGVVTAATSKSATIWYGKNFEMQSRDRPLYSDEQYRCQWDGAGIFVQRKRDGQRMSPSFTTEQQAIHALHQLYPQVVGR